MAGTPTRSARGPRAAPRPTLGQLQTSRSAETCVACEGAVCVVEGGGGPRAGHGYEFAAAIGRGPGSGGTWQSGGDRAGAGNEGAYAPRRAAQLGATVQRLGSRRSRPRSTRIARGGGGGIETERRGPRSAPTGPRRRRSRRCLSTAIPADNPEARGEMEAAGCGAGGCRAAPSCSGELTGSKKARDRRWAGRERQRRPQTSIDRPCACFGLRGWIPAT